MTKCLNITETQRIDAITRAQELMDMLAPVFEKGDLDEGQFKHAVQLYSQAVLMKVRLTSLDGRTA